MNSLGQQIASFRKKTGLTQSQFAEAIGVSQPVVAYYEKDKRKVPVDLLLPITKILNISLDVLLAGTQPAQNHKNKIEQRLDLITQLSRRKQDRILSVIDTLLEDSAK